jgi:hypothetical protein
VLHSSLLLRQKKKKVLLTLTSGRQHDPVSQTALLHPQLLAAHRPRQRRLPEDERRGADNAGVNFTNILLAAFAPKSFRQKITNPNCKHIKVAQKNYCMKKLLIKYW